MTDRDPYLLPPGAADDPRDLEIALVAHLLRAARSDARALRARLRAALPPLPARLALADGLRQVLATCQQAVADLEPAFLLAHRHRQALAAHRAAEEQFRDGFRGRLTHLGTDTPPRAWSHLGWIEDDPERPVALARDGGQVILVSGVQGSGKSVLATVLCEGGLGGGEPLCSAEVPPTAPVFFHIEEHDRLPQLLDGLRPNPCAEDLALLGARLGVAGAPLPRLRLAVLPSLLPDLLPRLRPYQDLGLEVAPLRVRLAQLGQPGLEAALGAEGGARFVLRMLEDAEEQGADLDLRRMRRFIDEAEDLNAAMKRAARARLRVLEEVAGPGEGPGLWALCEPGVATVVYLGGPHVPRGRVAPLLVGLLCGLLMPSAEHGPFQRVITVDEVNLLAQDEAAWRAFIRTGRLVRHRGSTLVLLGQDLLCVPDELFGLAGLCAVFQQRSPRVWDHLRERVGALRGTRFEEVAGLPVGEALFAATATTAPGWQQAARRVRVRPPRCLHGGPTRAAL